MRIEVRDKGVLVILALVFLGSMFATGQLRGLVSAFTGRRFAIVGSPMFVLATVLTLAWVGAVALTRVIRQPREPSASPATRDLADEPPAVVNLLVRNFDPTREALPATVLDLAARGVLTVEHLGSDSYQLRLREQPAELRPYEDQVLRLLRERAKGGVVPAAALTTGPTEHARRWWKRFRGDVIDEAQARGLSEDIWSGRMVATLTLLAVPVAPIWAIAFFTWEPIILYAFAVVGLLGVLQGGRRQRHTPQGLEAAARWLGIRRELRTGAFQDLPPSAVAVWERYLGYAAAMGLARRAVRAIPMGADLDRRAWSSSGGRWREVRVRYPRFFPPGYGSPPALVIPVALVALVAGGFLLRAVAGGGWILDDPGLPELARFARILGGVFLAGGLALGGGGLVALLAGLGDLSAAREIRGQVLRVRRFGSDESPRRYLALDDGHADTVRAWRVGPEVLRTTGLREGAEATAIVTRNLGYVREVRVHAPADDAAR